MSAVFWISYLKPGFHIVVKRVVTASLSLRQLRHVYDHMETRLKYGTFAKANTNHYGNSFNEYLIDEEMTERTL